MCYLLVLWGAEARAQEDSAEPDIRITLWNSIPDMEDIISSEHLVTVQHGT